MEESVHGCIEGTQAGWKGDKGASDLQVSCDPIDIGKQGDRKERRKRGWMNACMNG